MNRTLIEYYRCPVEFTRCFRSDASARDVGYFRFGAEVTCHGSVSNGVVRSGAQEELHDALYDVILEPGEVHLTFDPDEVVDNLRLERYCYDARKRSSLAGRFVNALYYRARPFLGVQVRRHIQRLRLGDWRSIPFPRWPIDATVEQLHEAMLRLSLQAHGGKRIPFIWFWPDGLSSCAMVTHDVEAVQGRDFCPKLMNLDESFGIKSSFQLVPEERYTLCASFLAEIRSRGFEINVHDLNHDGRLYSNESKFFDRVRKINHYGRAFNAQGFRSGALYRNLAWYEALEFSYDMSVPNAAHLDPQRGGCCTVMPYFIGKILELPVTTTQDYSLFYILNQNSIDLWKDELAQIQKQYGLASFIVHPDYLLQSRALEIYKVLLAYLAEMRSQKRVWIACPGEINQWWRARSQMRIVQQGDSWIIEGPEKDRARIAYACLNGDRLEYEMSGLSHSTKAFTDAAELPTRDSGLCRVLS